MADSRHEIGGSMRRILDPITRIGKPMTIQPTGMRGGKERNQGKGGKDQGVVRRADDEF